VLAVLVVAASTTALAAPQAPQAPQAVAAPCDDLAARIATAQAASDQVATLLAQVEQRLAAGGLRPVHRALLRAQARILQQTLDVLDARIDRLQARYDAQCGGGGGSGGGE
jgi:ABC-type transporter Mla subunit MlaD